MLQGTARNSSDRALAGWLAHLLLSELVCFFLELRLFLGQKKGKGRTRKKKSRQCAFINVDIFYGIADERTQLSTEI